MKVTLLNYTPDPDTAVYSAARTCYSAKPPTEHITDDLKRREALVSNVIASGHDSVLEHVSFTFAIEGISRVTSHQLVRHRMASYSQQSQRYCTINPMNIVIPHHIQAIMNDEKAMTDSRKDEIVNNVLDNYFDALQKLDDVMEKYGIPNEDRRYFYPQGTKTNIIVTMNARELRHFFELRCCNRAQWEIKELADNMLDLCKDISPLLFESAGAPCKRGECKETKPCGKPRNNDTE